MNILVEVESGDETLESNLMEVPKKFNKKNNPAWKCGFNESSS